MKQIKNLGTNISTNLDNIYKENFKLGLNHHQSVGISGIWRLKAGGL
jgi:hypothetical protein